MRARAINGEDVPVRSGRFGELFAAGEQAVWDGTHAVEGDPGSTGRWGASVVLLPGGKLADRLDELAWAAGTAAGGGHWHSGGLGRAHVTVRALEPCAEVVDPDRLVRYRAALQRALHRVGSLAFEFSGLGTSVGGVMVSARPTGSGPDELRSRLGSELGADGWLENAHFGSGRDPIWYCSILHFASPVTDPERLLAWTRRNADAGLGTHAFDSVNVCTWAHDGRGMAPGVAASVPTAAHR